MSINTKFKLINDYGDPTLMEEVEVNLKHWLDWSFLEIGAWTNVEVTSSGIYGGTFSDLYPIQDPNYTNYQIFAGIRKDWVHETGVKYTTPIKNIDTINYDTISGDLLITLEDGEYHNFTSGDRLIVTGNSIFDGNFTVRAALQNDSLFAYYDINDGGSISLELEPYLLLLENGDSILLEGVQTLGTGTGGTIYSEHSPLIPTIYYEGHPMSNGIHNIDYPNGKVILTFTEPGDSPVTASYSYRNVQVYIEGQMPHNFEIQKDSFDPSKLTVEYGVGTPTNPNFLQDPSSKIQLPAIIIEAIENRTSKGYELGAGSLRCKQDVLFTVIAQNKYEMKFITDVLANQKHKTLPLYDLDVVASKNYLPLTFEGYRNSTGKSYPEIINDSSLYWATAFIENAYVSQVETNTPDMYQSKVRYQLEVIKA